MQLEKVNQTQQAQLMKQIELLQTTSIAEAIQADSKTLAGLKKLIPEPVLNAVMQKMVDSLVRFYSVGKTMDSEQLKETSRLILKEFYFLKMEDFSIFFDRMKTGFYGKTYDRIDGSIIMLHLREYCEERIRVAEQINYEKHKAILDESIKDEYIIKNGDYWIRKCGNDFEQVDKKELATAYSFGEAIVIKQALVKMDDSEFTICRLYKGQEDKELTLMDYIAKHKPTLLPKGEAYRRSTSEYYEKRDKILSDGSLSEFEKQNKLRKLAGIAELTEAEFESNQAKNI